jgi:hypothetical protein
MRMVLIGLVCCALAPLAASSEVTAQRFKQNPLITVKSSRSLGDNVNGPSMIRVPPWIAKPLGRYYLYFADHKGHDIRLAYANSVEGPWKIYEPSILGVQETAFRRALPDPPSVTAFYTHIASPEIWIDEANKKLVMWFHGMWTEGNPWPPIMTLRSGGRVNTATRSSRKVRNRPTAFISNLWRPSRKSAICACFNMTEPSMGWHGSGDCCGVTIWIN